MTDASDWSAEFAIVGAGIAGATLAARLVVHASVLLIERETHPGVHSTGRSAAMFMQSYGPPQARALTRASRAFYEGSGPETPVLSARGALYVAWRGQEAELDAQHAALVSTGTAIERLDAEATLACVPVLRAAGLVGALHEADAMDIDVNALHQRALREARAGGATLVQDAGFESARAAGDSWTLQLAGGRSARARVLVNAGGAWADEVAARAGLSKLGAHGIEPRRRSALTFDAPPGLPFRDWPVTAGIDEAWYFKPDAGQLLGSPANADPVPAHDVMPEEIDIATAIARIEEHTTLTIRRPRRTWAGLRSFARDGELVIGFDPRPAGRGFFWLAGQGGYGIQSAAGAAWLAETLITGAPLPAALRAHGVVPEAMSPARLTLVS